MMQPSERGFTLVEVLVALLIFSIAILGLMRAGTQNVRAIQVAEQKQIAGMIADNQLILALHRQISINVGTQQDRVEMAGRNWNWIIRTEETSQANFFKLTVTIREEGIEQTVLTRTAYSQVRK